MGLRNQINSIKERTSFLGFFKDLGATSKPAVDDDFKKQKGSNGVDLKELEQAHKIIDDSWAARFTVKDKRPRKSDKEKGYSKTVKGGYSYSRIEEQNQEYTNEGNER